MAYCNAAHLPGRLDPFLARLEDLSAGLAPLATTDALLLMNGCDHLEAQPELGHVICEAAAHLGQERLVHGTLPEYLAHVRKAQPILETLTGEFRKGERSHLLPGCSPRACGSNRPIGGAKRRCARGPSPLQPGRGRWERPTRPDSWLAPGAGSCRIIPAR